MRFPFLLSTLAACIVAGSITTAYAEDPEAVDEDAIEGMQPVMVSLAEREPPSKAEWASMHKGAQRSNIFSTLSSLADFKSDTISFMDTWYYTPNSAEGTLASYGKMDGENRFDRYGHILGVEFDVPRNSWKERYVLNAAALVQLTGKARFVQFAGVELDTAVHDRRQIEVTFVGTIVPKDEAIRRLNSDLEALEYLGELHEKRAKYDVKKFKLLAGPAPPQPKIVLANVMMLDRKSAQVFEGSVGGEAESVIHGIGGALRLVKQTDDEVTLLTPVVRCYRTYAIEFRTDGDGKLVHATRTDRKRKEHQVPIVFDLTPDL